MKKITVEIESSDEVNITAESIERKWNHALLEENKIKVKNISSNPTVSGSSICNDCGKDLNNIRYCNRCKWLNGHP